MKEFANISPDSSFQGKKCSFELFNMGWTIKTEIIVKWLQIKNKLNVCFHWMLF